MHIVYVIAIDVVLLYLFFGHSLQRALTPGRKKIQLQLKDYRRHLQHMLRRDRDLMTAKQIDDAGQLAEELKAALAAGTHEQQTQLLDSMDKRVQLIAPRTGGSKFKEPFEIILVAVALAFGIRGLFLQPFKIPTGSMQPTLYGIHAIQTEPPVEVNPAARVFDYLNYSRRYFDTTVNEAGVLNELRPAGSFPLLPNSSAVIGEHAYKLPGTVGTVQKYIRVQKVSSNGRPYYDKGDVLARGALMLGDHLFVDRTRYALAEPARGDITVFLTDGITYRNSKLGGRYYIKRLVGLPGDTLKIADRKLHVKPKGSDTFQLLGSQINPAFDKIHSMEDGYRGYAQPGEARYLTSADDTFVVPENHYFMLGDNTESSLDSRYWGSVPRENLVGRAAFVWWPISRRWGFVDRLTRVAGADSAAP